MEHLRNLQRLLADGFISPAEYEHRRQQLIDKLTNTTLASAPEDERSNQNDKDRMERLRELKQASTKKRDVPLVRMRSEGATTTTSRATSSTTSTSTASYDSGVARTTSRTQGLRYEPYSCAPAADPMMDLAQKYTLSRKIGQLPESALPSVLKIVERLSPTALRQDGGDDWTFDLETLEDRTLWKLNDFVNGQLKLHFGSEKTHACGSHEEAGMVEEEKYSASTITTESDPEDMEEDRDAGLELNDDEQDPGTSSAFGQDYWATRSNTEELKAAKRPRLLAFGAGEKRKKKEDIKKKGKERRERERAAMAAAAKHVRSYSQERESESDEGEDVLTAAGPRAPPFGRHMEEVRQLELRERDAVDEMEKESESEYEREEYEDPEYTSTDTQLKEEDDEDEGSDGDEESDEDWTPVDNDRQSRRGSDDYDDYDDSADRRHQIVARDRAQPGAAQVKREPLAPQLAVSEPRERKMPFAPPLAVAKGSDEHTVKKEKEGTGATPGKSFKIQVCVYSLAKKSNTKKPYVCDACDKAFADRSNLIQHLRVHTKEKPYGCTYDGCEKRFAHSASLKEHLYTHTGDKPHVCNSPGCGMSFAQASNLRRHQLVHTGEKPFACEVAGCKKSFTQKINLAQHLKRVHKIVDNDIGGEVEEEEEEEETTKRSVRRSSKRSRSTSSTSSSSSSHGMRGTTSSVSKLGSR